MRIFAFGVKSISRNKDGLDIPQVALLLFIFLRCDIHNMVEHSKNLNVLTH